MNAIRPLDGRIFAYEPIIKSSQLLVASWFLLIIIKYLQN